MLAILNCHLVTPLHDLKKGTLIEITEAKNTPDGQLYREKMTDQWLSAKQLRLIGAPEVVESVYDVQAPPDYLARSLHHTEPLNHVEDFVKHEDNMIFQSRESNLWMIKEKLNMKWRKALAKGHSPSLPLSLIVIFTQTVDMPETQNVYADCYLSTTPPAVSPLYTVHWWYNPTNNTMSVRWDNDTTWTEINSYHQLASRQEL